MLPLNLKALPSLLAASVGSLPLLKDLVFSLCIHTLLIWRLSMGKRLLKIWQRWCPFQTQRCFHWFTVAFLLLKCLMFTARSHRHPRTCRRECRVSLWCQCVRLFWFRVLRWLFHTNLIFTSFCCSGWLEIWLRMRTLSWCSLTQSGKLCAAGQWTLCAT